jgi:chemotaxis protein methyltransferase CheR
MMDVTAGAISVFADLLSQRTGQELTTARRWRIAAVLEPLARAAALGSVEALARAVLGGRADLAERAVEALLNNETYFYRDRPVFDLLLGPALARLEQARRREKRLSIWCAGCSTGQEAWSLAMYFAERARRWDGWRIDILGTDVSAAAIGQARRGIYSQFEVQRGLAVTQMLRWFTEREGGNWQISPPPASNVRFERRNILGAPPAPARFDMILCRNVLLYFPPGARTAAFSRLASAVAPDGVLMLGAGETVIGNTDAFQPDAGCRGLYIPTPNAAAEQRAAS